MAGKEFGTKPYTRPPERRAADRKSLGIAVSLYSVTQSRVVLMLDASRTGAKLGGQGLPDIGKEVLLKVEEVELFGVVVRSSEGEAAIEFERPIQPYQLERLQVLLAEQTSATILHAR